MYSVLKNKRCHFSIPQNPFQDEQDQNNKQSSSFLQSSQKIVSSCFLDDVFILFLFNNGRYIIVNSEGTSKKQEILTKKSKKSKTVESQIVYDGNILIEMESQKEDYGSNIDKYSSQRLLSKSSMKFIEESYSKTVFTECKRIKVNECVITTRYSRNIYWLRIFRQSFSSQNQSRVSIKTSILQLPGTALSQILSVNKIQLTQNMTILTQLMQFDNSSSQSHETGSFCVKNEIVEDKMIYLTVYTRVPENIIQKYSESIKQTVKQSLKQRKIPVFIVTKFQFPIPVNEVSTNFVIQVSDKLSNQIAIYKQSQDDQNQRDIKIYRFGFHHIHGQEIINAFTQEMINNSQNIFSTDNDFVAIQNKNGIQKPITILLPQQFTSSINVQQFLRIDQHSQHSKNQTQYMIISINQTFAENQQNQPQVLDNVRTVRVNGQLFYLDQNGALRQPQNNINCNNCWVHSVRLTYHETSQSYSQHIERLYNFQIDSLSFLKVININYDIGLMYVLRLTHQSVDGQLYENKIDLINIKNGQIIEKGYCSLKNYSFSANQKYILDTPDIFLQESDYFYHIRIFFDKKSLYLFLFENANKYLQQYRDVNFIQTVLNLL